MSNSTALRHKFPKRLNTYNGKNVFRIFVNAEFDKCFELYKAVKDIRSEESKETLKEYLAKYNIDFAKTTYWYIDGALKLLVVSTGNDNTSREITIGSDIEDAAEGYYYGGECDLCLELYKHYGLDCSIDEIELRPDGHKGKVDTITEYRNRKQNR